MNDDVLEFADLFIILVEKSNIQTKVFVEYLNQFSIKNIKVVRSGKQAIDLMLEDLPDLVISSFYLPDMTGTDLVLSMRNNDILEQVPFMLISSETSYKALDPIRQAGTTAIIPKPFTMLQLKQALITSLNFINLGKQNNEMDLSGIRVLLVDDSKLARKHIGQVLLNLGIEHIDEAVNGKDAILKIESSFYDIVVTDYNMPEMDGEELTRYIRNNSSQSSIPILMVTSEGNQKRLAGVQQSGVSGICDKPFEPETVKQFLLKIL